MKYRRIVVKVGSSSLTLPNGKMNLEGMERLVRTLCGIANEGVQVLLVSSGAISAGVNVLGLAERPKDIPSKQAAAAVGQGRLMNLYERLFAEYGHTVGQVLLTRGVLEVNDGDEHVRNTIQRLLSLGVIPIVNENDTVAVDEIRIGDNDTLSAIVAILAEADLLVLLSDVDALYDRDPHQSGAVRIERVCGVTDAIRKTAGGSVTACGTGGMVTKLEAAERVNAAGIPMVLTSGAEPQALYRILRGENVGTFFEVMK